MKMNEKVHCQKTALETKQYFSGARRKGFDHIVCALFNGLKEK